MATKTTAAVQRPLVLCLLGLLGLAALGAALPVRLGAARAAVGLVFTMTNSPAGNAVVVYDRFADGSLALAGLVPTGGTGTGGGLGNQGGLILSEQGDRLLAVNAGSD